MSFFSPDYATARARFRDALAQAGGKHTAIPLDATGPHGEALTIDIGWLGAESAIDVLVHSCGVHGVEAFAGSAIQLQYLASPPPVLPRGFAMVFVHVANPYGMAWLRRANEHNVDLNRNCLGPDEAYEGAPDGYGALDAFLNPLEPPAIDTFYLRAAWLVSRYGMATLKQAIAGGQYVNPQGLFFGGRALEAGPLAIRRFIEERMARAGRVIGIDVHTGLGPYGADTLLVNAEASSPAFSRARDLFGNRVTPLDPAGGPAYRVKGTYETLFRTALPRADGLFVGQEHGTYSGVRVLRALRAENLWHQTGGAGLGHPVKRMIREMFAPADESWRARVLVNGAAALERARALLG